MPLAIPTPGGTGVILDPVPGRPIIIVGPNGSGKSALSSYLHTRLGSKVNRILSYRRLWLESSAPTLTGQDRKIWGTNLQNWDARPESRWRDQNDQIRLGALLVDFLNRQAYADAEIARKVRAGEPLVGSDLDGPLEVLNAILEASFLPISLLVSAEGELTCRSRDGAEYPAAEMSDGEKAALLLVADVLVAEPGTTHLVDEPERHLHRSISGSLITSLIETRPKDSFIIFTHDLDLAQYLGRQGLMYVCRGCAWGDGKPSAWLLDQLVPGSGLPDELTRAVLGGRSRILFHEGVVGSLDQELYEALLPGWTTVPAGNCRNVLNFVQGLNESAGHHWVQARGIVDKDFRNEATPINIVQLRQHEVENIFYTRGVVDRMAELQANAYGSIRADLSSEAFSRAQAELQKDGVRANIIAKRTLAAVRDTLTEQVQSISTLLLNPTHVVQCSVPTSEMAAEYDSLVSGNGDLDAFLLSFPIRESGARAVVANSLRYLSSSYYEAAVIQQVRSDPGFRDQVIRSAGLELLTST